MAQLPKKLLGLVSALALCAGVFTSAAGFLTANAATVAEWALDTSVAEGWTLEEGGALSVSTQDNAIVITKAKQDGWPMATLTFNEPVELDITKAPFLYYDIESNCAFNTVLYFADGNDYKFGNRLVGGGDNGDVGAGSYSTEGISLASLIQWDLSATAESSTFKIRGVAFYVIGGSNDGGDCRVTIRQFGLRSMQGEASREVDLTNVTDWTKIYEDCQPVAQDGSLLLKGNGTLQTSQMGSPAQPLIVDVNKATVLDLDITAHNGFNVTAMFRNPSTGKTMGIDLNCFLTERAGGEYVYGTYGNGSDNVEDNELVIDEAFNLRSMLLKAIEKAPKNEYMQADFTIPEDGILEIYEFRTQTSYVRDGEGMIIRKMAIRQQDTGTDILTALIGETEGVIDATAHTVTFTMPAGTDVKALSPVFTVSDGAKVLESGAKDFTDAQIYTVQAESGAQQQYTVTVIVEEPPAVPNTYYTVDLKETVFTHTEGDGSLNFSSIAWDDTKEALVLKAANPGVWANVDSTMEPVLINLNEATHLHFDMTAGNSWNISLFFNDSNDTVIKVDVNQFISARDGLDGLYYTGSYKDSISIRELIAYYYPDYAFPEDGLMSLSCVRFNVGYHGDKDASMEIRYLVLDDAEASHTLGESGAVKPSEPVDHYVANLQEGWQHTGEGDIGIESVVWNDKDKVMVVTPSTAGAWTNVDYTFGYNEKVLLDLNKAKYLHFELTAGNGWDVVVILKDDQGNTLALNANSFISQHAKGMPGVWYTGHFKEALPIDEMIEYAKEKAPENGFTVPDDGVVTLAGLRLTVGYHGEVDASIRLSTLSIDDQTASHTEGYKADVYSPAPKKAWTPISSHFVDMKNGDIGLGFVGYDASKGGLSIVPNKAGGWTDVDYNFAYGEVVNLNLNEAGYLHFDLTAGNGWDFRIILEDDQGRTVQISANRYLSEQKGMGYDVRLYKGDYAEKLDIKAMIQSALKADGTSQFQIPADGVVRVKELRIWVGYHGDQDASILVRKLEFNNQAGTNTDANAPATGVGAWVAAVCAALAVISGSVLLVFRKKRTVVRG